MLRHRRHGLIVEGASGGHALRIRAIGARVAPGEQGEEPTDERRGEKERAGARETGPGATADPE